MYNISLLDLLPEWLINWMDQNYGFVIFAAFIICVVLIFILKLPPRPRRAPRRGREGKMTEKRFAQLTNRSVQRTAEKAHYRSHRW